MATFVLWTIHLCCIGCTKDIRLLANVENKLNYLTFLPHIFLLIYISWIWPSVTQWYQLILSWSGHISPNIMCHKLTQKRFFTPKNLQKIVPKWQKVILQRYSLDTMFSRFSCFANNYICDPLPQTQIDNCCIIHSMKWDHFKTIIIFLLFIALIIAGFYGIFWKQLSRWMTNECSN